MNTATRRNCLRVDPPPTMGEGLPTRSQHAGKPQPQARVH